MKTFWNEHIQLSFNLLYHVIVILSYYCQHYDCANHYCVNGHPMNIKIGGSYNLDETIIPDIPDEPRYKRGNYRHCNWEITVDETEHHNSQILLEGVNLETEDLTGSSNKTQVNILLDRNENVTLGMFQVKPLSQRKHISVQINWDPKTQSRSPVNLRILIPVAGVCSRDMLSFNGSCHAITTVPANITGAVEHCSGDAMLASFTSMAHINEFIAANEAREEIFPYQSPLDLSKWVRLGMFHRAEDDVILSVVKTEIGCELVRLNESQFEKRPKNGSCGSLRVDSSGKVVLQFSDCSEKMPALMSFPEAVKSSSAKNCNTNLLQNIEELLKYARKSTTTSVARSSSIRRFNDSMLIAVQSESAKFGSYSSAVVSSDNSSIPLLAVICGFFLASLTALLLLLFSVKKIVSLHQKISQCSQSSSGCSLLNGVASNDSLHTVALTSTQCTAEPLLDKKQIAGDCKEGENHGQEEHCLISLIADLSVSTPQNC